MTSNESDSDTPRDDWHDELVAYLDGEVSASERDRIEQRLSDDEAYRSQLVTLERSWRLLDRLPTAEHDKDFTKSTIAMVTAELTNASTTQVSIADPLGKRRPSILAVVPWRKVLAATAAGILGYCVIMLPARAKQQSELSDLPVAQNLDLYRYVDSTQFLQRMRDAGLFINDIGESASVTSPLGASWNHTDDFQQISVGISELSLAEKANLTKLRERFEKLATEEKDRLRTMHQQLIVDRDSATLFQVLQGYRDWLATLSAAQRADLLDIAEPNDRVAAISDLRQEQKAAWAGPDGIELTYDDMRAVLSYVQEYLTEHKEIIISRLPKALRGRASTAGQSPLHDAMLWYRTNDLPDASIKISGTFQAALSPPARQKWVDTPPGNERKQLIGRWLRVALQNMRFTPSAEELELFYQNLDSTERDRLKQLPPEEMREDLRQLFLQERASGSQPTD